MEFKEFIEFMDNNLVSKKTFYQKAKEDQLARNARRAPAKRWNETRLDRTVDGLWVEMMKNIYDKFKSAIKSKSSDPYQAWVDYIEKNETLESLDEMMVDLEFE